MSPYWSILGMRFKASIRYRMAAFAGYVTQVFWGLILVMVLDAFYSSSTAQAPVPLQSMINYVWLGQALLAMLPWTVDRDIQATIRNGNVVFEFLRPLDLYAAWYVHSLAWRISSAILRALPLIITVTLVFPFLGPHMYRLTAPVSAAACAAFCVTYVFTVLLSSAITVFLNIVALQFLAADGLNVFMMGLVTLFSGMVIPLPLFPDALQPFLLVQPFSGLVDFPFRYYTGVFPVSRLVLTLPLQVFWTLAFVLGGRHLLSRARRRLVIQGG